MRRYEVRRYDFGVETDISRSGNGGENVAHGNSSERVSRSPDVNTAKHLQDRRSVIYTGIFNLNLGAGPSTYFSTQGDWVIGSVSAS